MQRDHAAILRDQYEHFWTEQLVNFPDGWGDLLIEFFTRLDKLIDFHPGYRRTAWVKLDLRLYPGGGGMQIKATPLHSPERSWSRPQREHLAQTLEWVNGEVQKSVRSLRQPCCGSVQNADGRGQRSLVVQTSSH